MIGPLNLQNIVGSHRPPWKGINEKDITMPVSAIKKVDPQFVSLSPHDSSDWSMTVSEMSFGKNTMILSLERKCVYNN